MRFWGNPVSDPKSVLNPWKAPAPCGHQNQGLGNCLHPDFSGAGTFGLKQ